MEWVAKRLCSEGALYPCSERGFESLREKGATVNERR